MSYLRAVFYLVVVAVALTTVACDEEEDFSVGESEVTVEAESGTMEFRLRRQNVTEQSQPVRIRVAHVVQLDVYGNEVTNCNDEPIAAETRQTTAAPMGRMFRRKRDVQPVVTGQTIHKQPRGGMRHPQPSNGGAVTQGSVDQDGIGHVGRDGSPPVNGDRGYVGPGGKPSMSGPEAPGRGNHPSTDGSGLGGVRFSNFARANFTVERKRVHQAMKHGRRGLKALQKRFHANLGEGVGKMAIDMSLPEDDGEIEIDGEKQKLKKGDLKFNIELSEWSWCGEEGDNGTGAFLDVYVEINSTRRPTMRRQRTASAPASFDLGDNTTMSFSGKVRVRRFS